MKRITTVMLTAQILTLLGFAAYPVALVGIQREWDLSNFQSGLIASAFFLGYVLVVPFATSLTDRMDAKKIYLFGGALTGLGLFCFGMLAENYLQACLCMVINGAGFAASYMPGLKIISDRLDALELSRPIAFYTAFFGVGTGFSYLIAGLLLPELGWRMVFAGISIGPLLALFLVLVLVDGLQSPQQKQTSPLGFSDVLPISKWKLVLDNKSAIHYILGYGIHCIELFASRNWIVAYLIFCSSHGQEELLLAFPVLVGLINFIGVPSSIIGNEIAQRQGRKKWINYAMLLSFMSALMFSLAYEQSWWVILGLAFLHMIFIMADSSTLTAGLVMSAQQEIKGAAMGLHSLVGFMGGLAGPALFGYVLDIAHKMNLENPWTYAYGSIVIASLVFVFFNWKNNEVHRAIAAFDR